MYEIPFKFEVGQKVKTNFNGKWQEVFIISRETARSESGKLYKTDPGLGSGRGTDENWFKCI